MRYLHTIFLLLLSIASIAQNDTDYIILTDGDTLYGNIRGVEPNLLRFEPKGSDKAAIVTLELVQSYFVKDSAVHVGGEAKLPQLADLMEKYPEQTKINLAGLKLQRSANLFYAGATITIIGVAGSVIGTILINNAGSSATSASVGRTVTYVGAGLSVVGSVVGMTAFIPISEAGIQLQKVRLGK
jgi:hypothetical protein